MKIQKLSHLMNRYLPSLGLALLIAIPIYTPAHASPQPSVREKPERYQESTQDGRGKQWVDSGKVEPCPIFRPGECVLKR